MQFFERAASMAALGGMISVSPNFKIASPDAKLKGQNQRAAALDNSAPLLPLFQQIQGTFFGNGFNQIFRPNSIGPGGTTFPNPINQTDVLMLNLVQETLTFSPGIGNIPNRGLDPQPDISLSALPYVQVINDVTNPDTGNGDGSPTGIHFEPGMFVHVPGTDKNPVVGATINRLASIPHGTTINAQAIEPAQSSPGAPQIPNVDITPFFIGSSNKLRFPSQTANNTKTARLPQDLTKFIAAGTITQDILDDPNTVLRNALLNQKIDNTVTFSMTTTPSSALPGGGTANNAFLVGAAGANKPNANATQMTATFWIETVDWTVTVPAGSKQGQQLQLTPVAPNPNVVLPTFSVTPPRDIASATNITAQSTQIQYSQVVILNFAGLSWPHASVNTLTQQGSIAVPDSAFN